jgi:hypothetical protein
MCCLLFDYMNNNNLLGTPMKLLSTVPHHAGSQASKENAEFIAEDLSTSRREKLISNPLGRAIYIKVFSWHIGNSFFRCKHSA